MEFWNNIVNVSKEAAQMQVSIVSNFSPEKRMSIALDFANLGVDRTREWIKENNPDYTDLEVSLEFVRVMYYRTGQMKEEIWQFYKKEMTRKIKKDWSDRFRIMMKECNWTYDDIAEMGGFKSGKVIEATVSRGLPSFARLSVRIYEEMRKNEVN